MKPRLGTSGWTYEHWKGTFYPENVPKRKWLEYFVSQFDSVELNASFYRIPQKSTVESWNTRVPDDFLFSVKFSRLLTHVKKLRNCRDEINWFYDVFTPLFPKTGVFLLQLPPSLKKNLGLLGDFCEMIPDHSVPIAVEFRNTSWYSDDTYAFMQDRGLSFCVHDMGGKATERIQTGPLAYVRFHGYDSQYGGCYTDEALEDWAGWINDLSSRGIPVFAYFNNDLEGFAVQNCRSLREMVAQPVSIVNSPV